MVISSRAKYDTRKIPVKRIIRKILHSPSILATEGARSGNFGNIRVRDALLFSGLRWPAAEVTSRRPIRVLATGFVDDEGRVEVPVIATTGQGQQYQVESAEGWWRDFAELTIGDERRALSFVRRRGDPSRVLTPERPLHTGYWVEHLNGLCTAALFWEPRNDLEVSRFIADDERVALFLRKLRPDWAEEEMRLVYRGLTPLPVARSLAAYLLAAALSSIRRRVPMRRCQYCSSWFELHRKEAVFCSPSCRAAH